MVAGLLGLAVAAAAFAIFWIAGMPGRSHGPALPPLSDGEIHLRDRLETHVRALAEGIGERHVGRPEALHRAGDYVEGRLEEAGWAVRRLGYPAGGTTVYNFEASLPGADPGAGCVIVGAHYDSAPGTPGANDNASGTAVVLELARLLAGAAVSREIRFVFFVNEESPWFGTGDMGSLRYAEHLRSEGDRVHAMLSVETVGYYTDRPGSQEYPFPLRALYPDTGNFVAFVGNLRSRPLVREAIAAFRNAAALPSQGAALPGNLPGIGWSDHWAFWQAGYRAIMVTDTAFYRYPHYHGAGDRPAEIDFDRVARLAAGLVPVVLGLAGEAGSGSASRDPGTSRRQPEPPQGNPGEVESASHPC